MRNIFIILALLSTLFSYSQEYTSEYLTIELNRRIEANEPYPSNSGKMFLPNEPYIITPFIIEPYTNYRAFKDSLTNKWIIPVAIYTNGCRDSYTLFHECKEWFKVYGNIQVGIMANLMYNE